VAPEPVAQSTRTDLVPAGAEAELPGFPAETAESVETREGRMPERKQRRRRQKPKVARGQQPASESAEEATGALAGGAPLIAEDAEEGAEGVGSATEDKRSPDRSKRRRRRGSGRRKGAGRDGEPARSDTAEEVPAAADDSEARQAVGGKAAEPKPDDAPAKTGSRKAAKSAKTAHRGIPSWGEAVGIVISANMEARAKKPSTSSSRSRGGRGRGGRDKSGDRAK
jgi:hypothetical protein